MRTIAIAAGIAIVLGAVPAAGQTGASKVYAGVSLGVDGGSRGDIPGGAVPSAGGLVGLRISDAWSVEVELERGFRTTGRTDEAVWISFAPPNSTRQEIERLGIRARFDRSQMAGTGFAAQALWRSREPGRVNVGLFAGVAARAYQSRVVRTTLHVPPEANLSVDHPYVQPEDERRTLTGGGPSGGLLIFVRLTERVTIVPELRYTHSLIRDDPYRVFRTGVRAIWSF